VRLGCIEARGGAESGELIRDPIERYYTLPVLRPLPIPDTDAALRRNP